MMYSKLFKKDKTLEFHVLNYSLLTPRRLRREIPTSTRTAFCLGKRTYTLSVGVNFRNSYGIFML